MTDQNEVLSELLQNPVKDITLGAEKILLWPASLAEVNDLGLYMGSLGLRAGDDLPGAEDEEATMIDFWTYAWWLVIRQGTPGMTPERILAQDWELKKEEQPAVMLRLTRHLRDEGYEVTDETSFVAVVAEEARLVGLFKKEEEDEEPEQGEVPGAVVGPESGQSLEAGESIDEAE